MKYSKWAGLLGVIVLAIGSFQPWIYVASKDILVTGMHAAGTNFGKPALFSLFLSAIAAILFLAPYLAAKRTNLFVCALNLAWSIRNFIILSTCRQGDCPEKKAGLYIMLAAAIIMIAASLVPDVKLKEDQQKGVSG